MIFPGFPGELSFFQVFQVFQVKWEPCKEGVCLPRGSYVSARWGSAWGCLPRGAVCHTPLWGQIDTCENITLPQTLFAGGNNTLPDSDTGLGLGFLSYGEIGSSDPSPSLYNVTMFCAEQCKEQR